ncbi:ABC transporter ATP-binding protein [Caldalkalibacillus mannanilyticus]|uniref:ABC transporter ATP-binding protein n=1 Tax=Caldalkalibacillus mannanilyticus TaxID=1418 RepID=UPI0022772D7F|nr:ABC transporter ATP-binding protein [Caldalkalibacillus mannanilyticus]
MGLIGSSLIQFIRLPLIFIAVFIYMSYINLTLTLLCLTIIPFALLSGGVFGLLLRKNSRLILNLTGRMNGFLTESFQGFHVIRSFTMEKRLHKKYAEHNQELYNLEKKNANLNGWFQTGSEAAGSISFIACLSVGAYFVTNDLLTIGSLLIFINLMSHLIYPLTGLAGLWGSLQRSLSAVERISDVLDLSPESPDLPAYVPKDLATKSIEFDNITFSYDVDTQLIQQVNLLIPSGKVIAIVGPSGAGKTTLLNLLQGFYTPQEGRILIDDTPIDQLSTSTLRSSIAYVHQETFLFSGSIRENLLIARPDVTEEEMIRSAIHANIHSFIMSLPDQYDTEIGERGVRLSGGQKQRMAIARALLKDAPILLLDEATSALDSETEHQVQEALERLMKDRTTLIIAHRLSTIQHADMIVVMDQGRIVQTGTHHDLISVDGLYRDLNRRQKDQDNTFIVNM